MVRTAFVSTYPPRACGLAAFTGELSRVTPDREIVAVDRLERVPKYTFEVHHRIRRDERDDYARTARTLSACADVVSLQFDDAVFGGEDGEFLLDFLRALRLPTVATLHTIHATPTPRQREILDELLASVATVVVMSQAAANLLATEYGIDPAGVEVLPYGVQDLPITPIETNKASVGLDGRSEVIVSIGTVRHGKGHELMLDALPSIVAAHPHAIYAIVGATHPDLVRAEGEAYRGSLAARARELGVLANVRFVPEFVGRVELTRWIQAADVFVAPNDDLDAIVSGPITHAMAAGRAIVATPTSYAEEILADGRGLVVPATSAGVGDGVMRLLADPELRAEMGARAYEHARPMAWARIGREYERVFEQAATGARAASRAPAGSGVRGARRPGRRSSVA